LLHLSGEETLNLRRLALLAQGDVPRLWERLALYAVATGHVDRLRGFLYREDLIAELETLVIELQEADLDNPDICKTARLPPRFMKALQSYDTAYRKIDTRNESKRLRWERTVQLQREKGASNAQICRALGLDAGNTNAYLKHADIDRFSLEKASAIMKYLNTL